MTGTEGATAPGGVLLRPAPPAWPAMRRAADQPLDIRHVVVQPPVSHPSLANGLHNVARRLILEQIAAGDHACLYVLSARGAPAGGVPDHTPCLLLPPGGLAVRGRPLSLGPALDSLLRGAGPRTVVHLHGAVKPTFALLGHRLRRAGIAYGVTLHGQYSHVFDIEGRPRRRLAAAYLRLVDRPVLSRARFVQAITPQEAAIIRLVAPAATVHLLPNAAYSRRGDGPQAPLPRLAPGAAPLTFGFCARYEIEHKGVDLLLDGFAAYRRAGGAGLLELIGTGPARATIEARVAAAGLSAVARVHGPEFGGRKTAIMAGWHYSVLSSRFDVMPTGSLEAALSGLPLIVTRETGLADLAVRHGAGLAIAALTPAAVAAALTRAERLGAPEWRAMAAGAHRMALAIGDWGDIAARLRALYAAP